MWEIKRQNIYETDYVSAYFYLYVHFVKYQSNRNRIDKLVLCKLESAGNNISRSFEANDCETDFGQIGNNNKRCRVWYALQMMFVSHSLSIAQIVWMKERSTEARTQNILTG